MAAPDGKLGDPYSSREETVRQMLHEIGRDTSDLDFTPAAVDEPASLPDDPDVHMAWDALRQVWAEESAKFHLFNTYELTIEPVLGKYVIPLDPAGDPGDTDLFRNVGSAVHRIAGVEILDQPAALNLVWRGSGELVPTLVNTTLTDPPTAGDDENFSSYGPVRVRVAYWMQWENIPLPYRHYIFVRAARRFARRALGEGANIQLSAQDEADALAAAKRYRLRSNRVSFQRGSLAWVNDRYPY